MSPLIVAALTTLGHAVFWFALAVFDLVVMAYGGEGALRELIPETVVRAKNGMHWAREHPKAFILDLVASAAFASFWLREFLTRSNPQPLWLVIAISLAIFGSSLVWWPLMISWVLRHPVITAAFMLAVLCSALSLYFFTVAEWIQISLVVVLVAAGLLLFAPVMLGMFAIIWPVIWGVLLAVGFAFRMSVTWLGLHGIARLLESMALVALGLAEYFHFYGLTNFQLTEKDWGQLAYFGAFCGALSVGFNALSFLSDRTRAWLGDTKSRA